LERGESAHSLAAFVGLDVVHGDAACAYGPVLEGASLFGHDRAYPAISEVEALVRRWRPSWSMNVEDDVIQLGLAEAGRGELITFLESSSLFAGVLALPLDLLLEVASHVS
jgi:hypothetical protein